MQNMNKYDFTVKRGDTFSGLQFQIIRNGVAITLTDAKIKADFRNDLFRIQSSMSTENGLIIITNPDEGIFIIKQQVINLKAGKYTYDVQLTLSDGSIKTYIEGIMTVDQDITE